MKKAVLIFMLIAKVSFAQCFNTEKQYAQKGKEMKELCEKMKKMIHCEVGFADNQPDQVRVLNEADNDALEKIAKNLEASIKYRSKDSTYIESDFYKNEDIAKKQEKSVGRVNIEQLLSNTKSLKSECVPFTKNGKTLYRGASLRVFTEDYEEWQMLGSSSSSGQAQNAETSNAGTFTDPRDKQKYRTVKIGKLEWMAENLNYKAKGSKCYDNSEFLCKEYGRLYNWNTAKKACPSGWHLSDAYEWGNLQEAIRVRDPEARNATALKSKDGWHENGNDEYGFAALPGGIYADGDFHHIGGSGYWWMNYEFKDRDYGGEEAGDIGSIAFYYWISDYGSEDDDYIGYDGLHKDYLVSVRCVRNY